VDCAGTLEYQDSVDCGSIMFVVELACSIQQLMFGLVLARR